jgi:uncharacterized protein with PIN domain
MKRRPITRGQVKAVFIKSDNTEEQLKQVLQTLKLAPSPRPFALCLECNEQLVEKRKEEVKDGVPPYVYQTQNEYMECPACCRIYWKGTHWQAMTARLKKLKKNS